MHYQISQRARLGESSSMEANISQDAPSPKGAASSRIHGRSRGTAEGSGEGLHVLQGNIAAFPKRRVPTGLRHATRGAPLDARGDEEELLLVEPFRLLLPCEAGVGVVGGHEAGEVSRVLTILLLLHACGDTAGVDRIRKCFRILSPLYQCVTQARNGDAGLLDQSVFPSEKTRWRI